VAQSQRKPQTRPAGSNLKPFYWALAAVAVLGLGWLGITALKGKQGAQEPVTLSPELLKNSPELVRIARGVKVGPDNAPIRILVFSDFMCPACRQFTTAVEPGLRTDFINTGKVQLVYHDFPLTPGHKWSFVAARAARCAEDQGKFWEYHDLLFQRQQDWMYEVDAPVQKLNQFARDVGLNAKTFEECLSSDRHADLVTANKALGEQLRVSATPTLLMSPMGVRMEEEWKDYGIMKARLDKELAAMAPKPATTQQ
jgi:protein-disulfide isomerase